MQKTNRKGKSVTLVDPKSQTSTPGTTSRNSYQDHDIASSSAAAIGDGRSSTSGVERSPHDLHAYDLEGDKLNFIPIIYDPRYDIKFFKIQKFHPFDSCKWGKIARELEGFFREKKRKTNINFLSAKRMITKEELQVVHSPSFVDRIHNSKTTIIMATEVPILAFLPMKVIRSKLLDAIKWQVSGSILAAKVALDHGWAIHLGGGFHHCSSETPGGFCLFADITLMIRFLWNYVNPSIKVLILDLDAHQGNGHERDILSMSPREQSLVYIMDVFNASIYPHDEDAKDGINRCIELRSRTNGKKYLELLSFHLKAALDDFAPDLVIYNAGTDILSGDPLGRLNVEFDAIIKRDQIVFTEVLYRRHSIVMLTSGGYHRRSASVVAASIQNLFNLKLIL